LAWTWLGTALAAAGRRAEGARGLAKAAALDAKSWSVRKALADLHAAAGDWKKALPHLRRAAELAPTTIPLLMEHAAAAARLGREDEALSSLRKARELDPRFADARELSARVHLARAARRQKKKDFAGQAEDFRAALAAAPELFSEEERARLTALLDETDGGRR
jgi:tetratricopeptide (TPR) repeat protein